VEVGRCVRRFGGTQCVWSYEVSLELWWKSSCITGTCHFKSGTVIVYSFFLRLYLLQTDSSSL
jgi:hypothetical protein